VTPKEVLSYVARAARPRRVVVVEHARERMQQRRLKLNDLLNALQTAKTATFELDCGYDVRWLLSEGKALDGDDLDVAVGLDGEVVVVTVW
jgi:hypothetical protein